MYVSAHSLPPPPLRTSTFDYDPCHHFVEKLMVNRIGRQTHFLWINNWVVLFALESGKMSSLMQSIALHNSRKSSGTRVRNSGSIFNTENNAVDRFLLALYISEY